MSLAARSPMLSLLDERGAYAPLSWLDGYVNDVRAVGARLGDERCGQQEEVPCAGAGGPSLFLLDDDLLAREDHKGGAEPPHDLPVSHDRVVHCGYVNDVRAVGARLGDERGGQQEEVPCAGAGGPSLFLLDDDLLAREDHKGMRRTCARSSRRPRPHCSWSWWPSPPVPYRNCGWAGNPGSQSGPCPHRHRPWSLPGQTRQPAWRCGR